MAELTSELNVCERGREFVDRLIKKPAEVEFSEGRGKVVHRLIEVACDLNKRERGWEIIDRLIKFAHYNEFFEGKREMVHWLVEI
jgi:hypothetical protein